MKYILWDVDIILSNKTVCRKIYDTFISADAFLIGELLPGLGEGYIIAVWTDVLTDDLSFLRLSGHSFVEEETILRLDKPGYINPTRYSAAEFKRLFVDD
jgi:hypothetical protein